MFNRRTFLARLAAIVAVFQSRLGATETKRLFGSLQSLTSTPVSVEQFDAEYIVVGSGAGGGTVAARLAELGHRVLLFEAGGDPKDPNDLSGGNALYPGVNTLPEDYEVPAFHPNATENEAIKWDFFVRHYANLETQKQDPKYYPTYQGDPVDGVLYPRASALGGCTAHNAMILVYPHNEDWQQIADMTSDPSWAPDQMRKHFEKLENCRHRSLERLLKTLTGRNPTRHGFGGWLTTEHPVPLDAAKDKRLLQVLRAATKAALDELGDPAQRIRQDLESLNDPNDWHSVEANAEGIRYTPLTTSGHARIGPRERIKDVEKRHPDRLLIVPHALAGKVIFDGTRAIGVEYYEGRKLYRTHGEPSARPSARTKMASREVILCGGAFNTPQLLMLSGIGPQDELTRCGIKPIQILERVGKNLQDRYEIGVVHRLKEDFRSLDGATFRKDDEPYQRWLNNRTGIYSTNGAIVAAIKKSVQTRAAPDLFCFGLAGNFHGYFPNYSTLFRSQHDRLTWAILKAHTVNRGGRVTLKSADPLIAPEVNFHYFEEGTDKQGEDLDSVVEGIKFVRKLTAKLSSFMEEELPGPNVKSQKQLKDYVRANAWGHHASCTCPISKTAEDGVVDSNFKVHGVTGLRVVDASVFPRVPGFFIVSSIYIVAEKAAEVIHADAVRQ